MRSPIKYEIIDGLNHISGNKPDHEGSGQRLPRTH
jgi:hypothetical protein